MMSVAELQTAQAEKLPFIAVVFDDQEIDARASTGTIYWEGAVRASEDGAPCGGGYLELTGYAAPLSF